MKFYVYCVAGDLERLDGSVVGISDQAIEVLTFDGLSVVASKFEDDFVPVSRGNVLTHEAVVRKVLSETTPLPFRFGTLVSKVGLNEFVKAKKSLLNGRLSLVQGCVEMSIKIIWQPKTDAGEEVGITTPQQGIGAAFLLNKQRELRGGENLVNKANDVENWLLAGLNGLIKEQRVRVEPKLKLVLSGSYLINRAAEYDFRARVNELQEERPDLHFLTSGPWPPYSFANNDLEFETHFGVS